MLRVLIAIHVTSAVSQLHPDRRERYYAREDIDCETDAKSTLHPIRNLFIRHSDTPRYQYSTRAMVERTHD
jgi:hypothetical protein